jgi:hypothetical protein
MLEDGARSPGSWIIDSCKLPCGCWEWNQVLRKVNKCSYINCQAPSPALSFEILKELMCAYSAHRVLWLSSESGQPICGNGMVEQGEECDCGYSDQCKDDCCFDANQPEGKKCKLKPGKQCRYLPCQPVMPTSLQGHPQQLGQMKCWYQESCIAVEVCLALLYCYLFVYLEWQHPVLTFGTIYNLVIWLLKKRMWTGCSIKCMYHLVPNCENMTVLL